MITESVSPSAARFHELFWTLTAICGAVALAVLVTMVVLVVRFHHGRGRGDDRRIEHETRFELSWTLVTFVAFLGMFSFGALAFLQLVPAALDTRDELDDPLEILVTSKRWMWKFDHPEGGPRELGVLHVPAGRPVRLHMTSEDVIHSFFVPDFRLKRDVVPGRANTVWFEANEPGTYLLLCAEYCGRDHSRMRGEIVVMDPEDYAAWRRARVEERPVPSSGEQLFRRYQCHACHVEDGVGRRRGPALEGLYGGRELLADGREIVVDEAYLRESILTPAAARVAGWSPSMPPYAGRLSEAELARLVLYLRNLDPPNAGARAP